MIRKLLKKMSLSLKITLLIVFALLLFSPEPFCFFPDYNVESVEPEYGTIKQVKQELIENPVSYKYFEGMSMYPIIKSGQFCQCVKQDNYEVGDLITFYVQNDGKITFVGHKIIEQTYEGYRTKGINNVFADTWVIKEENIFCKVTEQSLFDRIIGRD